MEQLGYPQPPAAVYQDNKSTIVIAERGTGFVAKTKHIPVRYYYVQGCIRNKEIGIQHLDTQHMRADFLTKPLQGQQFYEQRALAMGTTK